MHRIIAIFLLLALAACKTSTELASFTDPKYRHGPSYRSAVVYAFGFPLNERRLLEDTLVAELTKTGVRGVRGIDITPPTREHSDEEFGDAIRAAGVDSVIMIAVTDKVVRESYTPPTYVPGAVTGYTSTFGNTTYLNVQQSPGYYTGGGTVRKPKATYKGEVIDVATGDIVWQSDATSRGNAFAKFDDLAVDVAQTTVAKLSKDRIIPSPPKK